MARFPGVGDSFGHYSILRMLGRGGMGVVFEALDQRLRRSVALKVLSPIHSGDPDFRHRFEREASLLASLDSPHVVQIFEYGEIDGCLFLASQLVRDGDLKETIARHGPLAPVRALEVARQVSEALVDASEVGVVHRDVKPSNILLRFRGEDVQAYLCDFGIALAQGTDHTHSGVIVGTRAYMSPERIEGDRADVRSDTYALGCVLWEALTGKPPFDGSDLQIAMAHLKGEVPQLPGADPLDQRINALLRRAMAKAPEDRFQVPEDFRAALVELIALARAGVAVPPAAPTSRTQRMRRRASRPSGGPLTVMSPSGVAAPRSPDHDNDPSRADHVPPAPPSGSAPPTPSQGRRARPRGRSARRATLVAGLVLPVLAVAVLAGQGWRDGDAARSYPDPVAAQQPSAARGGTLRVGYVSGEIGLFGFDPITVQHPGEANLSRLLGRTVLMVRQTARGDVLVPDLATGLGEPSDGDRTWTYRLRTGIRDQSGSPVTSQDVAASIRRAVGATQPASAYFAELLAADSSIATPDDHTLVLHLSRPVADFDPYMALPQTTPVTIGLLSAVPNTGPYMLRGTPTKKGFTLVRNRYWDRGTDPNRSALPNRIEFVLFRKADGLNSALTSGSVDLALMPEVDLVASAQGSATAQSASVAYAALNPQVPPFDDVHCRRAFAAALDLEAVRAASGTTAAVPALTLIPRGVTGYSGNDVYRRGAHPRGDLATARRELARCDQANKHPVEMWVGEAAGDLGDVIGRALLATGDRRALTGNLTTLTDRDGVGNAMCNGYSPTASRTLGICVGVRTADWRDGFGLLARLADPDLASRAGSQNIAVRSAEYAELFRAAQAASGPAERARLWAALDRRLVADALVVPLYHRKAVAALPPGATNLVLSPLFNGFDLVRLGVDP